MIWIAPVALIVKVADPPERITRGEAVMEIVKGALFPLTRPTQPLNRAKLPISTINSQTNTLDRVRVFAILLPYEAQKIIQSDSSEMHVWKGMLSIGETRALR
jgi:hypothetical protein